MFYNFARQLILPLYLIEKLTPKKGLVIELGSGQGVIAQYLALNSLNRNIIAVDLNKKRFPTRFSKNLKFTHFDIRKYKIPRNDCVIISDVLHHLQKNDQQKILQNSVKSLNKEGILIIKEIDKDEFLRSKLSRLWDLLLYPQDKIYYQSSRDLTSYLKKLNLKVKVFRPLRFFPGSTTLYVAKNS